MGLVGRKQKDASSISPRARHPGGRPIVEDPGYAPAAIKRLADAAVAGMADSFWGTSLGMALLKKQITTKECSTGKIWDETYRAYLRAIDCPAPDPKSVSIGEPSRGQPPDPDSFAGVVVSKKDIATVKRFLAMERALNNCGLLISSATRALCESKSVKSCSYEDLQRAKIGLAALADHLTRPSHNRK